jgi:hypothetical protein
MEKEFTHRNQQQMMKMMLDIETFSFMQKFVEIDCLG